MFYLYDQAELSRQYSEILKAEGAIQEKRATVIAMLQEGMSTETIARCTRMPLQEVQQLAMQHTN